MSVLPDRHIRRYLDKGIVEIDPRPADRAIQPASVDLHLADDLRVYVAKSVDMATAKEAATYKYDVDLLEQDEYGIKFLLPPGGFVLGRTVERIRLGVAIVGRVEGKSSLGRLGLSIHSTAGFIDPGFDGTITLEISNENTIPVVLRPGRSICQLSLLSMIESAERPYGHPGLKSKYQGQTETTASRYEG